jgi:hypothetical protein
MRHCHKLGKRRATQYCMVRRVKSSHFKFDELSTIILPCAEGDWEDHHTKRLHRITWDNAVKRGLAGNQHVLEIQAHFLQSADEDEIEPAPSVDEDLGKLDLRHHGIQDQGELAGLRKACPLVITRERDGDLRPMERPWYCRLDGQNLPKKQLLVLPGTKILISPEDDVDNLRSVLKLPVAPMIFLIIILEFFVSRLLILLSATGVAERPPKVVAVNGGMAGARVPWALLLQELLELLLRRRLLAPRRSIDSRDDIIWLSFPGWPRKVPLALVAVVVVWAPQIAVLTPREPLPHLLFLLGPIVHHVTKARNSFWPVLPEIPVYARVGNAVEEAVDDVLLRDVRDSGTNIEEATRVGPQELIMFLFTLGKIVSSTCTGNRSLEIVDEDLLKSFPGVDGVAAEALQPSERCRVQSHREVDDFGDVGAPCDLNGRGVATEPLLGSLLAIVLGDTDWLEALWILVAAETSRESRESITTISTFSFDFFAGLAPRGDHGARVATFIDVLVQVLRRRSSIGLSQVTPLRWLLPPTGGLAPSSVVVADLVLGTTTSRPTASLTSAFVHTFFPDDGCRIVLIQLDPGPLRIEERLTYLRIMAALEDGRHPGDVGHRSPETPFAYGGKLRVELAIHRSPSLIGPPPPDCVGPVPSPPRLSIGVVLIADVGRDLIFRDHFKVVDGKIPTVLAFFGH